ncbi:MAG: BolA protein [Pelagibacterales bacterium]|jgi:BolA protein|nr:BolA protein [Pelagibacterales bacterium]
MNNFLKIIEKKISENVSCEKILVIDNSHKHKKHKFFDKNKYHLKLEIDSEYLKSLNKIAAQREIMSLLKEEFKDKIHALEIAIK